MTPAIALNPAGGAANFLSPPPVSVPGAARNRQTPALARHTARAPISATVLTRNSEALLSQVLTALAWCDEVVVLDTGSTDSTLHIAAAFANVSLHRLAGPFPGFGRAHQRAVELARNDWVLSIDSDELVTPALADEIAALPLSPLTVYTIPFRNHYNGRHITTCGWSPDRHERLFNRRATNFCASEVHERVQTAHLTVVSLSQPIDHYSYRGIDDFLRKTSAYSRLFVEQNTGRKKSGPVKAVARSAWAFFKSYILERGFLQGTEGLTISAYKSQVVFWKYLSLHEANRRRGT